MEKSANEIKKTEHLWQRIAWIAGGFALIICALLILNYLQLNSQDPVNTKTLDALVERLNQDPTDVQLRDQIRTLDLLARKSYFTNQWQIRTGGYLLLICVAIVIISMQVLIANRKKIPLLTDQKDEDFLQRQKTTRKWISIGGSAVVFIALFFAYLSHQNLEAKFNQAVMSDNQELVNDQTQQSSEETQETKNEEYLQEPDQTTEKSSSSKVDSEEIQENIDSAIVINEEPAELEPAKKESPSPKQSTSNFPNFRGPGGNGITQQVNLPISWNGESGENILWKVPIPIRGFNSPVIWGNKLFLSGAEESNREVYCLDASSGEFLWTTSVIDVPGSPANPPEVANYTGHSAPTMATDGKQVYAIFANGDIAALDMDGKRTWARNLGAPVNHYGYSSSLLVYKDKVIVQYDQKNLAQVFGLSTATGETVWSTKRDVKISWASPVIVNTGSRDELILAAEPFVISYNPDIGSELWRIDCIYGEVGPSIAYADGVVFAVNDYSKLSAIKLGTEPSLLWEDEELLSDVPSPVTTDKYLIMPASYGVVACYDTKSGEKYWEYEIDNTIYASPLISEGKVYLIDKQGVMHIFMADKEFKLLGTPKLGEKIVCTPAFTDGRIYLRGYDNLYCVGK